jgi:hypothetical protein
LKTQQKRKFPINAQLADLLNSIRPEHEDPEALVFPSKERLFHSLAQLHEPGLGQGDSVLCLILSIGTLIRAAIHFVGEHVTFADESERVEDMAIESPVSP